MQLNAPPGVWKQRSAWAVWAAWAAVLGLLYVALRSAPLGATWAVLSLLGWEQIVLLIFLNLMILGCMALRWWWILRSMEWRETPLRTLLLHRLAGFGVSFFTPGPQFGGEPVQVDLLRRRERVPLEVALSSVYLDRLLDLMSNFTFLAIGIAVAVLGGFLAGAAAGWVWAVAALILALPGAHLAALYSGRYPASYLVKRLARGRVGGFWGRAVDVTTLTEERISGLCRARPVDLLWWSLLSALIWVFMVIEYGLTLQFLGVSPSAVEVISMMTAGRLALLTPVPGGLGALEASQVLASQAFGWGPEIGLALSLIARVRDFFLALLGIGWGGLIYLAATRKGRSQSL